MRANARLDRPQGLTLIELMVAMAIGLVLALAISQMFLGSRLTHVATNEGARMQENARFALALIERELRMAGFKRHDCGSCTFPGVAPIAVADGTGLNRSDEVIVRFYGSGPAGGAADNSVYNCIGEPAALDQMVVDRFYVGAGASGEPALFCESVRPSNPAVTTTTELVSGVESLQVLVGEDTDGDRSANRYLGPADPLVNLSNAVSIKVSLLVRSSAEVMEQVDNRKFNHFGVGYAPGDVPAAGDPGSVFNDAGAALDRRMRRLFATTVALRNRVN